MLADVVQGLTPWQKETREPEPHRVDVVIYAADLIAAVESIRQSGWGYLSAISGLDHGPEIGNLEVLYHFCGGAEVLTLRVPRPRAESSVRSICSVFPSARLFEQELHEMFGLDVVGLPDTGYLFLPDDWDKTTYPLLKDAILSKPERSEP